MDTQNITIELSKEEATERVMLAFTPGNENLYDIDIELPNGRFMTATPENLSHGVKFWFIK